MSGGVCTVGGLFASLVVRCPVHEGAAVMLQWKAFRAAAMKLQLSSHSFKECDTPDSHHPTIALMLQLYALIPFCNPFRVFFEKNISQFLLHFTSSFVFSCHRYHVFCLCSGQLPCCFQPVISEKHPVIVTAVSLFLPEAKHRVFEYWLNEGFRLEAN